MMFFKSGSKKKGQRGFTIIELLVALAIFSIISSGVAYTVMQMLNVHASATNRITAIRQVQNAGYWVSQDAQQAQIVLYNDDPYTEGVDGFLILLSWVEWEGIKNVIVYNLTDDGELVRSHYQGGIHYQDGVLIDEITVAKFVETDEEKTSCKPDPDTKVINLTVTATVGGFQQTSETRVYEIIPRPGL